MGWRYDHLHMEFVNRNGDRVPLRSALFYKSLDRAWYEQTKAEENRLSISFIT